MGKEYIEREAAKNAIYAAMKKHDEYDSCERKIICGLAESDDAIDAIPAADVLPCEDIEAINSLLSSNVHLCDSCEHTYPDCPAEEHDVLIGVGDCFVACAKYKAADVLPVRHGRWERKTEPPKEET